MSDGRVNWIERNPSAVTEKLIRTFADKEIVVSVETIGNGVFTVRHGGQTALVTAEEIAYEFDVRINEIVKEWNEPLPFQEGPDDLEYPAAE